MISGIHLSARMQETFQSYWLNFIISIERHLCLNIHSPMFTRLLNVTWSSYIFDNAQPSSGLQFIRLSGPYFSCDGLWYIHPLFFKWLNPNHFPSLCDCNALGLPIRVRVSVLINTVSSLYYHTRGKLIFRTFRRWFMHYFWEWVIL